MCGPAHRRQRIFRLRLPSPLTPRFASHAARFQPRFSCRRPRAAAFADEDFFARSFITGWMLIPHAQFHPTYAAVRRPSFTKRRDGELMAKCRTTNMSPACRGSRQRLPPWFRLRCRDHASRRYRLPTPTRSRYRPSTIFGARFRCLPHQPPRAIYYAPNPFHA